MSAKSLASKQCSSAGNALNFTKSAESTECKQDEDGKATKLNYGVVTEIISLDECQVGFKTIFSLLEMSLTL